MSKGHRRTAANIPTARRTVTRPAAGPAGPDEAPDEAADEAADQAAAVTVAKVEETVAAAATALGGDDRLPDPPEPPAGGVDAATLTQAWRRAAQAERVFKTLGAELTDLQARLAGELASQRDTAADLAARSERLEQAEQAAQQAEQRAGKTLEALRLRTAELDERDSRLLSAEAALLVQRQRAKEELLAEVRAEFAATRDRLAAQLRTLEEEVERNQARALESLATERDDVAAERRRVAQEWQLVRQRTAELEAREEDLADARTLYAEREQLAVAAATERWQLRCSQLESLHRGAREHADDLERQLAQRAAADRAFGTRSPDQVLAELERLRADSAELRRLELVAPDETRDRLIAVEQERQRLQEGRTLLLQQNAELQRELSGHQITAVELERLKVSKAAMSASVEAYAATVSDLERQITGLIHRRDSESPFPECSRMDRDLDEAREDLDDEPPHLPDLITRVRALIRQQHQLYYDPADLRCFLGGLAATRLHLLQGISGTGKTQLPQRFAEAIGATSVVVSVGADWRTPQDLMGYYNAFERRFYESEFTQAVYRAQCRAHADQPFVVVLDEMNLSHPEQYFNDVLSALEREAKRSERTDLVLMTSAVEPAPRLLHDGRRLPVPGNVWFVGTANHDETTLHFADKTYDRAHVMELPARYERFQTKPVDPLPPLSWPALDRSFRDARKHHMPEVATARKFLAGEFADRMLDDFDVAWGNRLNWQLGAYVPVVQAAGGDLTEAVDHIIATKILRKLRGRHDLHRDLIERLRDDLPGLWQKLSADGVPDKSDRVLWRELRDRGAS